MKKTVIITAGGIGKRMGANLPKQFLLINGKPILWLTLKRFYDYDSSAEFIITLPTDWIDYWKDILTEHGDIKHQILDGGVERYDSVKNALKQASGEIIAIHDGVRPFPTNVTIENCFTLAEKNGCAVPVLPLKESLRSISTTGSKAEDRANYRAVQTPQCFKKSILGKAYEIPFSDRITDDASLVELAGFKISLCDGNEENIKITTPIDLKIGEVLIEDM